MAQKPMTYAASGVDYGSMDPYKKMAQQAASSTDGNISRHGFSVVPWSRGESAFLIEMPWGMFAFVIEGLGTKQAVADAYRKIAKKLGIKLGKTFYANLAQCTEAMKINDLITVGAVPIVIGQYLAVGVSNWFDDNQRCQELVEGTVLAATLARCCWGPGETPTLKGTINPETCDLAGAAAGWIADKSRVMGSHKIRAGYAIIILESSGIHANGLTLARLIGERKDSLLRRIAHFFMPKRFPLYALSEGYMTKLPDGRTYGETLLDPTKIYATFVEDCLNGGVDLAYGVNITGHGWRKFMRATQAFTYVIECLPTQLPIFDFIQKHGPVTDQEAYGNYNMGAGFAVYLPPEQVDSALAIAQKLGFKAFLAGRIEEGEKQVIIKPKNIVFKGETLQVR